MTGSQCVKFGSIERRILLEHRIFPSHFTETEFRKILLTLEISSNTFILPESFALINPRKKSLTKLTSQHRTAQFPNLVTTNDLHRFHSHAQIQRITGKRTDRVTQAAGEDGEAAIVASKGNVSTKRRKPPLAGLQFSRAFYRGQAVGHRGIRGFVATSTVFLARPYPVFVCLCCPPSPPSTNAVYPFSRFHPVRRGRPRPAEPRFASYRGALFPR